MRWARYVRQANVEVAQDQSISNPVLAMFGEGLGAVVGVHSLADSEDLALFVQFVCGQRRSVDAVATGVANQPNLDLPTVDTAFGTASARVPSGGSMQIVLRGTPGSGARVVLTVQARYAAPRAGTSDPGGVAVLPVSALTSAALRRHYPIPDGKPLLGDNHAAWEAEGEENGVLESGQLADIVREAVGDDEGASAEVVSGHLLVAGSPQTRQTALATVRQLQDRLLRNTVMRCSAELEEVDGSSPFAPAVPNGQRLRLHDVALPSLPGRRAFVFRGIERNAVRTMLSEIAQGASSMSPFVEALRAGVWLSFCVPDDAAGDMIDAQTQLDHLTPAVLRTFPAGGVAHLADVASLRAVQVEALPLDRPVAVATGTAIQLEGRRWRPALLLRRTEVPARK
jgi:hypothetical protein